MIDTTHCTPATTHTHLHASLSSRGSTHQSYGSVDAIFSVNDTILSTCIRASICLEPVPLIQVTAPYALMLLFPVQDSLGQLFSWLAFVHSNKLLSAPLHIGLMKRGGVFIDEQTEPLAAPV